MTKCIIVGVTGGIAAYKTCQLVSNLRKKDFEVHVIMTKNATEFVAPLTFEVLSGNRVSVDTFDRNFEYNVNHIALAKKADCFVIAPATANVIAKIANGLADDMLTTTFLAAPCKKVICPAMNTGMLNNPVTIDNINKCRMLGFDVLESDTGFLACGDQGKGRLIENDIIELAIEKNLVFNPILLNKNILISAGPTQEALDPVRFISNHSSGKMGYALAKIAMYLGANVTLVAGPTNLNDLPWVTTLHVVNAKEMAEAIKERAESQDIIIMAAAVADFTISNPSLQKIKKNTADTTITLEPTEDILSYLGNHKVENQILCGFAMETENLIKNATKKCIEKNCDFIIANNLTTKGAGFKNDTNQVTIISKNEIESLELMSKDEVALRILKRIIKENDDAINN